MFELRRIVDALAREHQLQQLPEDLPVTIAGVADHTDEVRPDSLFCAVVGTHRDGHEFLATARDMGASVFLVSKPTGLPGEILVRDSRIATAIAAAEFAGRPADGLLIVGVTGTNGKSTTVHIIRHLLNAEKDTGALGTLGAYDGNGDPLYTERLTTPGPIALHKTLADLARKGTRTVVMEVSSHALHQKRLHGVSIAAGVFTNFSRDHLDYHSSWHEYYAAKESMTKLIAHGGWRIVNADDPAWGALMSPRGQRRMSFGLKAPADVSAEVCGMDRNGTELTIVFSETDSTRAAVILPLLGEFNASNALGASACAYALDLEPEQIVKRLRDVPQVPGRMETVGNEDRLILRDYSHTPDSLLRAARAARSVTTGRLIVLFGCGGDRDKGKRAEMGRIAAEEADVAVVTSDNPRTEDPGRIITDIEEGMHGNAYLRIVDRREAIHRAVGMMNEGDCLLLAGKGHETYQVVGTARLPFDEREIVAEVLNAEGAQ